jgi:hypothetical protein
MQEAVETFADDRKPLPPAAEAQGVARDELRKALEILSPPPPESPPEPPKQDPESGQDEAPSESDQSEKEQAGDAEQEQPEAGGDEGASASEDQLEQSPESQDPAQLMQGVRDREAERRQSNERKAREQRRSAPVEKDW